MRWECPVHNANPNLDIAALVRRSEPYISEAEAAAYNAPFPDASYKAGVWRFPNLVPSKPDAPGAETSRRALAWWSKEWNGQSFMAVGAKDPILGRGRWSGCAGASGAAPPPMIV